MSKEHPAHHTGEPDLRPEAQTDESHGHAIKRPQENTQRDLPRGSEKETHHKK